MPLSRRCW